MRRRRGAPITGLFAVLALLAAFAHASLHLAHADDGHFSASGKFVCQIASLDGGVTVPPAAFPPLSWARGHQILVRESQSLRGAPARPGSPRGPPSA